MLVNKGILVACILASLVLISCKVSSSGTFINTLKRMAKRETTCVDPVTKQERLLIEGRCPTAVVFEYIEHPQQEVQDITVHPSPKVQTITTYPRPPITPKSYDVPSPNTRR